MNTSHNTIQIESNFEWQWPALTEKQAFHVHQCDHTSSDKVYVGCPWVSIIDFIVCRLSLLNCDDFMNVHVSKNYLLNNLGDINFYGAETHTVCQSIYWKKMVGFWRHIGIKNLHVSHLTEGVSFQGVSLHPWHLIAPNREVPKRGGGFIIKSTSSKKYLCSFVGAFAKCYEELRGFEIRSKLRDIFHDKSDVFFELKDAWFYEDLVYKKQLMGKDVSDKMKQMEIETDRYNRIMSDSVFSLCPEGTGPNTLRLWESMSIGVIPVLFESDWVRPHQDLEWSSFSVTIPKGEINQTYEILRGFSMDKIEEMRLNCINAYNSIRTRTCF